MLTHLRRPGRGFSRSPLMDSQDYAHRLERDADDAAALLQHYSPDAPAFVIGNSSGAIVSLRLLARHPSQIRTLLCYEPPLGRVLPDFKDLWAQHEDIYATYRAHGMHPAFVKFSALTKSQSRMATMMLDPDTGIGGPFLFSNMQYWFEREFMTYPQAEFDVPGDLEPSKGKLVLVNGEESPRDAYQFRGNVELGKMLGGVEVTMVPGGHVAHATHAEGFAERVVEVLKGRGDI